MDNIEETNFRLLMQIYSTVYKGLAKVAKTNIGFVMALKRLINSYEKYSEKYSEEEKEIYNEYYAENLSIFNPDVYLNQLGDSLVCIDVLEKSILSETYGTETICGKYHGLVNGYTTKILGEDGKYKDEFSNVAFEFGYPEIENRFIVTLLDLKQVSDF